MRAASLARYLPAEGIQLDVLTARNASAVGADVALLREIPAEVTVHRTLTLDLPFGIRKWIKRLVKGGTHASGDAKTTSRGATQTLSTRLLQKALRPDPQVTWLPVLTRVARRIITKRKIDLALITVPPFSTVLLVEKLRKALPGLPIVVDFRDEWLTTTFDLVSFVFNNTESQRDFASRAEASGVENATAIVAVTEAARRTIRARYPEQPEHKFVFLPNGFDATRLRSAASLPAPRRDERIVVTHVGTIYASTEPTALVEALQSLPSPIKARFRLRFVGHIEEPRFRKTLLQLGEMVELVGYQPQYQALTTMNETDYVLLINHDPLNVGGKFYEYIGSGKPILGAVHPKGETRRLLEELRAGWWAASDDVAGMRQLFLDAVGRGSPPLTSFQPDLGKIAQYERKVLAQRYAALLHSIAGKSTEPDLQKQTAHVEM